LLAHEEIKNRLAKADNIIFFIADLISIRALP